MFDAEYRLQKQLFIYCISVHLNHVYCVDNVNTACNTHTQTLQRWKLILNNNETLNCHFKPIFIFLYFMSESENILDTSSKIVTPSRTTNVLYTVCRQCGSFAFLSWGFVITVNLMVVHQIHLNCSEASFTNLDVGAPQYLSRQESQLRSLHRLLTFFTWRKCIHDLNNNDYYFHCGEHREQASIHFLHWQKHSEQQQNSTQ